MADRENTAPVRTAVVVLMLKYAEQCKKTDKNRTVRINTELNSIHQEVLDNLESIHGALFRTNPSDESIYTGRKYFCHYEL